MTTNLVKNLPEMRCLEVDPIRVEGKFLRSDGVEFIFQRNANRVSVLCAGRTGRIEIGSATTGSMWQGGNCFGEYEFNGREYKILPYDNGNKQPDKVEVRHPLDYLANILVPLETI